MALRFQNLHVANIYWYLDFFWLHFSTVIASNLLLVDEIMRAGMSSLKG